MNVESHSAAKEKDTTLKCCLRPEPTDNVCQISFTSWQKNAGAAVMGLFDKCTQHLYKQKTVREADIQQS